MDAISWYQSHIEDVVERYESLYFEDIHNQLLNRLPEKPLCILDIGAGTGRDASWLAEHGHQVMAVEPSVEMRKEGQKRHPNPNIAKADRSSIGGAVRQGHVLPIHTGAWRKRLFRVQRHHRLRIASSQKPLRLPGPPQLPAARGRMAERISW